MANKDFFVSFGSDADAFSKKLGTDLSGARKEIEGLTKLIGDLDKRISQGNVGLLANALKQAGAGRPPVPPQPPGNRPPPPPTEPTKTKAGSTEVDMGAMVSNFKEINVELGRIVNSLATAVPELAEFIRLSKNTASRNNRSTGQTTSPRNDAKVQHFNPRTGLIASATDPGAVQRTVSVSRRPSLQDAPALATSSSNLTLSPVRSISGTPQSVVSSVSSKDITASIEKSTVTLKSAINQGVDRIVNALASSPRGGAGAQAQGAAATAAAAATPPKPGFTTVAGHQIVDPSTVDITGLYGRRRDRMKERLQGLYTAQENLRSVSGAGAPPEVVRAAEAALVTASRNVQAGMAPRAEAREMRRAWAREDRASLATDQPSPTAEARQQRQSLREKRASDRMDLALASDVGALRSDRSITKEDLRRILDTFSRQGVSVGKVTTKTTRDELLSMVGNARRQFVDSGKLDTTDLFNGRQNRDAINRSFSDNFNSLFAAVRTKPVTGTYTQGPSGAEFQRFPGGPRWMMFPQDKGRAGMTRQLTDEEIQPLQKAFGQMRRLAQQLRFIDPADNAGKKALDARMEAAQSRFINLYEKVTGLKLPTQDSTDPKTGAVTRRWNPVVAAEAARRDAEEARLQRQAENRRIRRQEDAGLNLTDPRSLSLSKLRDYIAAQTVGRATGLGSKADAGEVKKFRANLDSNLSQGQQIDAIRDLLARSGVRWSKTLNPTLNEADAAGGPKASLEKFFKELQALIKSGTLRMTSYPGTATDLGAKPTLRVKQDAGTVLLPSGEVAKTSKIESGTTAPRSRKTVDLGTLEEFEARKAESRATKSKEQAKQTQRAAKSEEEIAESTKKQLDDLNRRLKAIKKVQAALAKGAEIDESLLSAASAGSNRFKKNVESGNLEGIANARKYVERRIADLESGTPTSSKQATTTTRGAAKELTDKQVQELTKRLAAIEKVEAALAKGKTPSASVVETAAAGSKRFVKNVERGNIEGIVNAREAIQNRLSGGAKIAAESTTPATVPGEAKPLSSKYIATLKARLDAIKKVEEALASGLTPDPKLVTKASADSKRFKKNVESGNLEGIANARIAIEERLATGTSRQVTANLSAQESARATRGGGKSFDECCTKIVAAVNEVTKAIKAGVKVTGKITSDEKSSTSSATGVQRTANTDSPFQAQATQAGRDSAIAAIRNEALRKSIQGAKDERVAIDLATQAVVGGYLKRSQAVEIFAAKLGLSKKQATDFEAALKRSISDTQFASSVSRGNENAEREGKRAQERLDRARSTDNTEALRNTRVAETLSSVTDAARREVDALKASIQAKESDEKINLRLITAYRELAKAMSGMPAKDRKQAIKDVFAGAGFNASGKEMDQLARSAGEVTSAAEKQGQAAGAAMAGNAQSAFERVFFHGGGFWNRVFASTGTFIVRNFAAGFVFGITNALQDIVAQAIETESAFVRISHALESTGREAGNLRTDLVGISTTYGVALRDVYATAAGLTGMFENPEDIAAATKIVAELEMISGGALSAKEAMGALASITSAYGMDTPEQLQHVADVLTVIQNRLGTNLEVSAEGLGRIAGLANQIGLGMEEAAVYVSAISKLTNQTGAAAGEQFQRIIAVMQSGRGQSVLKKELAGTGIEQALLPNPQTGTRDYNKVIEILLKNYNFLTAAQKENISVTLGGQRQAAAINALLSQGARILDTTAAAHMANGDAEERAAAIAAQLNKQIDIMRQNFVSLGAELVRGGILSFFQILINILNRAVGIIVTALSKINTFFDQNGVLSFLRSSLGFMVGLGATIWVVTKAVTGLAGALKIAAANGASLAASMGITQGAATAAAAASGATGTATAAGSQAAAARAAAAAAAAGSGAASAAGSAAAAAAGTGAAAARAPMATAIPAFWQRRLQESAMRNTFYQGAAAGLSGAAVIPGGTSTPGVGNNFYGRMGTRAAESAARMGAMAASQAALFAPGGAATGAGVATRTGARATAIAANAAAQAMNGLSKALTVASQAATATTVSIMALALVGVAALVNYFNQVKKQRDMEQAYEARFTQAGRDAAARGETGPTYVGPNTENAARNREDLNGFDGFIQSFMTGIKYSFIDPFNITGGLQKELQANAGDLTGTREDYGSQINQYREYMKRLRAATTDQTDARSSGRGLTSGTVMSVVNGGTAEDVLAEATAISADIDRRAKEIRDDSEMSTEQKTEALADLEETRANVEKVTSALLAQVAGIADVNRYTIDQIKGIDQASTTLLGVYTSGSNLNLDEFTKGIAFLIEEIGLSPDSEITGYLKALSSGEIGLTDALQARSSAIRSELESLVPDMQAAASSGNTEALEELKQSYLGKLTELSQNELALFNARVQGFRDRAAILGRAGNFTDQRTQLTYALRLLQARKEEARGVNPELFAQLQIQENALVEEITKSAITQATSAQKLALSRERNSIEVAKGELEIAEITLRELQQRDPGNFEAIQQATEARNRAAINYLSAQEQLAASRRETAVVRISPVNTRGIAEQNLANAFEAEKVALAAFGKNDSRYEQALQNRIRAQRALEEEINNEAVSSFQRALATAEAAGDTERAAQLQVQEAERLLARGRRRGASKTELDRLKAGVISANANQRRVTEDIIRSQEEIDIAIAEAAGDTVEVARLRLAATQGALARALINSGGVQTAEIRRLIAQIKAQEAALAVAIQNRALAEVELAATVADTRGDSVEAARYRAEAARMALEKALRDSGGKRTEAVIRAEGQVASTQAAYDNAVNDVARAQANLLIAFAEVAGNSVKAARLRLQAAQDELRRALERSGGERTAEVINAEAAVAQAEAAQRDAVLQDKLDTINFNMQMGRMTSTAAIAALRDLLKTANLTKAQRRSILLQIKGLQDEVRNQLTGSGFNITDIKLPSAYQVRKSLALDGYQEFVQENASSIARMRAEAGGDVKRAQGQGGNTSAPIVAALQDVRKAVSDNGAQVVHNKVTMNNNVPTQAIANAIVEKVMNELDRRSARAQRSNTSTPRTVRTT